MTNLLYIIISLKVITYHYKNREIMFETSFIQLLLYLSNARKRCKQIQNIYKF
jgi:hypothetical protein